MHQNIEKKKVSLSHRSKAEEAYATADNENYHLYNINEYAIWQIKYITHTYALKFML